MKVVCVTIVSEEYEPQYKVQLESLLKYLPGCIPVRVFPGIFKSKYKDPLQHICSIRPKVVLEVFRREKADYVLFLGADVVFYNDPWRLLDNTRIVCQETVPNVTVTPHITEPLPDDGKFPSNEGIQKTGHINSDLILWKKCPEVIKFLEWQAKLLETKCLQTDEIFLDQTSLNCLPFFVPDVKVLRHPSYNVAYWNYNQRTPILKDMVCYQFSGFDPNNPKSISKHQNRYEAEGDFLKFLEDYAEKIK